MHSLVDCNASDKDLAKIKTGIVKELLELRDMMG